MAEHVVSLEDVQADKASRQLLEISVIAIGAVMCGADGWVDVETFGESKQDWLRRCLELPHGIPSHDTFGRLFG